MKEEQIPVQQQTDAETNLFLESVESYSVKDIPNGKEKQSTSYIISLLLRCSIVAMCIALVGYSGYKIVEIFFNYKASENAYDDIRNEEDYADAVTRGTNLAEPTNMLTVMQMLEADGEYTDYIPTEDEEETTDHYLRYYKNFLSVQSKYDDVYAWIYMSNTNINYPVMKGEDNTYYLTHNYKGETYDAGSIFADARLSEDLYSNYNLLIYGHNMKNGSMFRSLKNWCSSSNIKTLVKTTQIEIYTSDGLYIYDILSYYVDDQFTFDKIAFSSASDYLSYLKNAVKKSYVKTNKEYTENSRICTLVTCTNGNDDASRYVVHGILRSIITFDS